MCMYGKSQKYSYTECTYVAVLMYLATNGEVMYVTPHSFLLYVCHTNSMVFSPMLTEYVATFNLPVKCTYIRIIIIRTWMCMYIHAYCTHTCIVWKLKVCVEAKVRGRHLHPKWCWSPGKKTTPKILQSTNFQCKHQQQYKFYRIFLIIAPSYPKKKLMIYMDSHRHTRTHLPSL